MSMLTLLRHTRYGQRVFNTQRSNLIGYWKLGEASGTTISDSSGNARNGTYSGVTLAQGGIGDGGTSPLFDGSTSYGNVFSTSLRDAFNATAGSLLVWMRAASGVWSDSVARRVFYTEVNASNFVGILKTSTNTLQIRYRAGATISEVSSVSTAAFEDRWYPLVMTWNKTADQFMAYLDGVQIGTTQTGLGVWSGVLTSAVIGASTVAPTVVWSGNLAHVALWSAVLTPGQVAGLAAA